MTDARLTRRSFVTGSLALCGLASAPLRAAAVLGQHCLAAARCSSFADSRTDRSRPSSSSTRASSAPTSRAGIAVSREVFDERASLLGDEQERWLFDGFNGSKARWNVIPQQVMVAPADHAAGPDRTFSMDQWSGCDAARTRLMKFLATRRPSNPIVLTGDIHSNWVNDLKVDFFDPKSPVVATEFVGRSITSGGDGADRPDNYSTILAENPFVKFYNGQRGYVSREVTAKQMRADYRIVEYVTRPGAPRQTRASFVVEDGRPGAQEA